MGAMIRCKRCPAPVGFAEVLCPGCRAVAEVEAAVDYAPSGDQKRADIEGAISRALGTGIHAEPKETGRRPRRRRRRPKT